MNDAQSFALSLSIVAVALGLYVARLLVLARGIKVGRRRP